MGGASAFTASQISTSSCDRYNACNTHARQRIDGLLASLHLEHQSEFFDEQLCVSSVYGYVFGLSLPCPLAVATLFRNTDELPYPSSEPRRVFVHILAFRQNSPTHQEFLISVNCNRVSIAKTPNFFQTEWRVVVVWCVWEVGSG